VRARAFGCTVSLLVALTATDVAPALAQDPAPTPDPPQQQQQQQQQQPAQPPPTGGSQYTSDDAPGQPIFKPTVPGIVAKAVDGVAYAPDLAPPQVQQAIWAANTIVGKPYVFGGGHTASFSSLGYDCSGAVSFALHGGGLLARPRDSSDFLRFGAAGPGEWITVYTNPRHAFVVIAGLRLDTSAAEDPGGQRGARWRPLRTATKGYRVRHPVGF
jgi:cell wall-associated NlpC family hydrolase